MKKNNIIDLGKIAYLENSGAAVIEMDSDVGFLEDRKFTATRVIPGPFSTVKTKDDIEFVPFGRSDQLPIDIMNKIHANTIVGSNIDFKIFGIISEL